MSCVLQDGIAAARNPRSRMFVTVANLYELVLGGRFRHLERVPIALRRLH